MGTKKMIYFKILIISFILENMHAQNGMHLNVCLHS